MRTFLERQHRQRLQSLGWGAQVHDFSAIGCAFRMRGMEYALIRSGSGFMPTCGKMPIWHQPEYPDAALAVIYRHANQ
jgi:hypothetical protein